MPPNQAGSERTGKATSNKIELTINGKPYKVSGNVGGEVTLNSFIRETAHLKGTKFMCLEGGCGACIVSVKYVHPATRRPVTQAVNSCLVPVLACHGWSVTTVEGIGNKSTGYDKVQKRLAAANGTQCGYCSPGMVMNMYSLLQDNPKITMKEVENSFGGNICRCTGYRPILDAFKSLASDAPPELVKRIADIEDMVCPKSGKKCGGDCNEPCHKKDMKQSEVKLPVQPVCMRLEEEEAEWYRPVSLKEVFEVMDMIGDKSYRIIAGNTGHGVYRITKEPDVYIDVNGVGELHGHEVKNTGLELGANMGMTEAMNLFYNLAKTQPNKYAYCHTLGDHIDLIANVPVRNVGTLGGNLYMKHLYEEFPSDIFLFLETVGAQLQLEDGSGVAKTVGLLEFLQTDMNKRLITKILLPVLNDNHYITRSYKIMPRAQNAHAYVNAGFMVKVDKKGKNYKLLEKPTIVFGGINPKFVHANKTEDFLNGKDLLNETTLKTALDTLSSELSPDHVLPDASPEFRKGLALSLFYKFVLSVAPDKVNPRFKSGGQLLERGISSGKQEFDTNRNVWPLNKPIPKIEALIQCSGEAEYTNDIPNFPGELWAQLALCDRAGAIIESIDPSEALKMPGVVAFFSAKDITGENNFIPVLMIPNFTEVEKVFAEGKTDYAGQAVGVVVAESHALAIKAAGKVKVNYKKNNERPILDVREIVQKNMTERIKEASRITPKQNKSNIKYKISGKWDVKSQYHYTMETQTCLAVPVEDGIDLYPASQWPAFVQAGVSITLGMPTHKINVRVRRLGGAYGAKISRSNHVACVAALCAHKLHRPVRFVLKMENNMEWMGIRFPVFADYEVETSETGEIQSLTMKLYEDDGHGFNDATMYVTLHHLPNAYDSSTWSVTGYTVKTDTASNTWCRAPGSTEAICLIENVMEHIANVTGKDPIDVRLANMTKENAPLAEMVKDLKASSEYDQRVKQVEEFNKNNRWKKRGISLVLMNYPFGYFGNYYSMVSIFAHDGTVAITHGGIEMGQGLNTKVAQVAAHTLGIGMEYISIKPTMSVTSPNNMCTGGSLGSEAVAYATKMCCEELNKRLEDVKKSLGPGATWEQVVKEAFNRTVNLNATYMFTKEDNVKPYTIYGVTITEVELDLLTGQYHTVRVDLMEDAGESLSPEVDVGQVEGAFIMGLGYFTCEEIIHDPKTGRRLTNRTWNYKPPGVKDIPIDMRITLRKNAPNPVGVLRSKATGEPPLCMSSCVVFALRNALESARKEAGAKQEEWFTLEQPLTGERLWLGTLNSKELFKLN